ncbi:MAG: CDGSH iron-sulfur domain-containing protein [Bacteroidetes bacterium]|nr:MAG: CDGSH iron-sulfur domain-containing protein [Bacteroidota bacterium]
MENPDIPQKSPFIEELQPGVYAWCACGKSSKQPYCDGSHSGTSFRPVVEKLTEPKKVAWCGCKYSGKKPYCDGSHRNL